MKTKGNIQDIYPLTPMQEGMLFHSLYEPSSSAYFVQIFFGVRGQLEVDLVERSLNELLKRYDVLRTAFLTRETERPVQVVIKERPLDFLFEDVRGLADKDARQSYVRRFMAKDRERLFDLSRDVLMRVALFRLGEQEYGFVWSHHHILMDGWCSGIIISEFLEIYRSFKEKQALRLAPVTPFRTYINWLERQDRERSKRYWRDYLEDYEGGVRIPQLNDGPGQGGDEDNYKNEVYEYFLSTEKTVDLGGLALRNQVTVSTALQVIWGVLLGMYNGCGDVVYGLVVSGRPSEIAGVESMVGLFINTIPVRIRFEGETTFNRLVRRYQQEMLQGEGSHYLSLAEIQSGSRMKQDLLDHIFVFENYPVAERIDGLLAQTEDNERPPELFLDGLEIYDQTNYDFNIIISGEDRLKFRFVGNGNVYSREDMERIGGHMGRLVDQVVVNEEIPLRHLELISPEERQEILNGFNNRWTGTDVPLTGTSKETIHGLFEQEVERVPGHTALVHDGHYVSYEALNRQANRLARVLRSNGLGQDDAAAVMVERSIEMVVGLLAILKAGAAYLPIEPTYPENRIEAMLTGSGVAVLLGDSSTSASLADLVNISYGRTSVLKRMAAEMIRVDRPQAEGAGNGAENLEYINEDGDLLYVIYTSGSTGTPKGVMLEHRNLVNLLRFQYHYTDIDFHRVLQFTTISFDVSAQEIFSTLLAGGRLCLVSEAKRKNLPELFRVVDRNRLGTLFLPAAFLKFVFNEEEYSRIFPTGIKHIVTAGEQIIVTDRFKKYLQTHQVTLHNHYGPSETHVVTALTIKPSAHIPRLPSIGRPILNTRIYILDPYGHLQPVGVAGELFIGGRQVGRGYRGQAELTAQRFVSDPFVSPQEKTDGRLYRTGDLARFLPGGEIEFLGRLDHQVKIRGFRVEVGEIESHLLDIPVIKEAAVRAFEDESQQKYLCAYVAADERVDFGGVKTILARSLPDYMIPAYFVQMEAIPLSPNGKVDYRALQPPDLEAAEKVPEAPQNDVERKLLEIWAEVLGLGAPKIGVRDNFFDLGGNSLNILKIPGRIKKAFDLDISISVLFLYPTVRELAANIREEEMLNKLESVVRLNNGGQEKNIFMIHPLHGMIYPYKDVARLLEDDYNFYGIQARGLLGGSRVPENQEILVADYTQQMKTVQPQGPYIVAGYCYGCMIAYDVVRLLEDLGDTVEKLILLDQNAFISRAVYEYYRRRARRERRLKALKSIVSKLSKREYENRGLQDYEKMAEDIRQSEAGKPAKAEISTEEAEDLKMQVKFYMRKLMQDYYRKSPYQRHGGIIRADVLDIKAKDNREPAFEPEYLRCLTFGHMTLVESPGDHDSILLPPQAEELAAIIKSHLNE